MFPPENPFSGRVGLPQRRRTSRATAAPAERPRCRTPVHSSQARPPKGSLLAHPCRGLPSMLGSVRLPHPYLHTLSCPISSLPQLCFSTQRACSNADSGAGSLGCSLRTCISHELPGDANAAGPLTSAGSQAGPRLLKSQRSTLRERKAQSQASLDSQPGCFSHRALGPRQMGFTPQSPCSSSHGSDGADLQRSKRAWTGAPSPASLSLHFPRNPEVGKLAELFLF